MLFTEEVHQRSRSEDAARAEVAFGKQQSGCDCIRLHLGHETICLSDCDSRCSAPVGVMPGVGDGECSLKTGIAEPRHNSVFVSMDDRGAVGEEGPANLAQTPRGSVWTNDALALLPGRHFGESPSNTYAHCAIQGHASAAFIPLECDEEWVGLLELRDRRSDFFSSRSMEAWEGLAARLTRGLARHTLAQRLRRTERRYYSVLDGVGDPLVVSFVGGKILEVNAAACEVLGYSRDELPSFAVVDICSREDARRVSRAWDELKGSGQVVYEIDLLAKDGRRLPVETVSRMVDWEGDTAVLSISRDLAERRRLTEQAIESERRLRKLFEQSRSCRRRQL